MCVGQIWIQIEGLAAGEDGLVESPLIAKELGQIAVVAGLPRIQGDGAANQIDGQINPPGLPRQHAEQLQRVHLIRVPGKDFPVNRLGLGESPGAVMPDRKIHFPPVCR